MDKVILITGAKGGLGNSVTRAFLETGAAVAGVSRSVTDGDFDHPRFRAFPAELSSSEAARSLVARVVETFGRVDVLVHLLGGFAGGLRVDETEVAVLEDMLALNVRCAFATLGAVLPVMRSQGRGVVLAVGSKAAVEAAPGAAAYAASKAALVSLIRSVAAENADRCISANVILPTTMDTPANRKATPDADFSRWVQPAQVANLLVSLAGDGLGQVNGAVIPVYGKEQ